MRTTLLLGLLLLAPIGANSGEPVPAVSLQAMVAQQEALRGELARGNAGTSPRQAAVIRKSQEEFFAITQGKTSLEQLSIDEKVRLENALEKINAAVVNTTAARDGQNVCWRERKTDSRLMVTRCGTQAERDEAREGARAWMSKPKICIPPGCGS